MLLAHELATYAKNLLKERVVRMRPRSALDREEQRPRAGRGSSKEESSFPSGHSAGATAVAPAFSAEYPTHGSKVFAAAGAAALAQLPRSAHYPTDLLAGIAIGAGAETAIRLVWPAAAGELRQ